MQILQGLDFKNIVYANIDLPTYVHISNEDWSKLDQKYKKCAFDGYIKGMNEFKLWDPTWKKMLSNIYVVVDE